MPESDSDRLWSEYSVVFKDFDDLTLARWMAQTLGQLQGKTWRLSHPLVGAYRLAAQVGHDRQIWLKKLATAPLAYPEAECCRSPLLPLLTRDVLDSGLICLHCAGTVIPFDDIPGDVKTQVRKWAQEYGPLHSVAHDEEAERRDANNYEKQFEKAANDVERLLAYAGNSIMPLLIEHFPAIVWEDQDECLEVRPEDIPM